MRAWLGITLALVAPMLLVGCGPEGPRTYPVTGTITYQGEPIESGSIVFDPADGQGQAAMGGIENGQIVAQVPEGEKIVRISAVRTLDKKDQYGEAITQSYIPDKYNGNSDLRWTIKPEGENKFDVDLE